MIRIGHGFDMHRVAPNRALILGGIAVPWDLGLLGHSDADVLLHAVIDAYLGALALGDIGQWFPDTDKEFEGIASSELLRRVLSDGRTAGWRLVNLDATVMAQRPRLAGHIPAIRRRMAELLGAVEEQVSVKATTTEETGAIGRGQAISVHAVLLLESSHA